MKRLVRERQAQTGEAYVTALRHVRGPRRGAIPVSEYIDITEMGELLGIDCRVMLLRELAARIDVARTLRQLRSVLLTTTPDPPST